MCYPPKHPRGVPWKEALQGIDWVGMDWVGMVLFAFGGTLYVVLRSARSFKHLSYLPRGNATGLMLQQVSDWMPLDDHNTLVGCSCSSTSHNRSRHHRFVRYLGEPSRAQIQHPISTVSSPRVQKRERPGHDSSFFGRIRKSFLNKY